LASEMDIDLYTTMRRIEARERELQDGIGNDGRGRGNSSRGLFKRSILPIALIVSVLLLLLLAFLAGLFGAEEGKYLWRDAYRSLKGRHEELGEFYSNQSSLLNETRDQRDRWRGRSESLKVVLEECRNSLRALESELNALEERHARAELELCASQGENRELRCLLNQSRLDAEEIRSLYQAASNELDEVRLELCEERCERVAVETRLEANIALLHSTRDRLREAVLELNQTEGERDSWIERFHNLELENRELLCSLRICRIELQRLRGMYRSCEAQVEGMRLELESCLKRMKSLRHQLEESRRESERLRRLYEVTLERFNRAAEERDRWKMGYLDLDLTHTNLLLELARCEARYDNLSRSVEILSEERDRWKGLYEELQGLYHDCIADVSYWRGRYYTAASDLEDALATISELSDQLASCGSDVEYWRTLYESRQAELDDAVNQAAYWRGLYEQLANISVDMSIGNITVLERESGKPSRISADLEVCVSFTGAPVYLFLEYWAEPIDCVWGYGSLVEDVSDWAGRCKTFHVVLDFGTGVGPYKVIAKARLQPIHGYVEAEEIGPE